MSKMRKIYMVRFICRCLALLAVTACIFLMPELFQPLERGQFLTKITPLHMLWVVWMIDMLTQLIPSSKIVTALGSQKSFRVHFRKAPSPISLQQLTKRAKAATKRAYIIFVIWAVLTAVLGWFHAKEIIGDIGLLWVSTFFYVCDLICVLFWCPFRHFIMKNRCCTTCRIFNWDHLMMFSPMLFVNSFFARSLATLAIVVFIVWEFTAFCHPERFDEGVNQVLRCSNCTDLLCINAQKIHKK